MLFLIAYVIAYAMTYAKIFLFEVLKDLLKNLILFDEKKKKIKILKKEKFCKRKS